MARMAPVFGWMTTTEQFAAGSSVTSCWHACCASNCSAGMIVSLMDWPSLAGVACVPASGIATPSAPISTCSLPVVPVSRRLYSASIARLAGDHAVSGLTLVKPTRLAVALPSG